MYTDSKLPFCTLCKRNTINEEKNDRNVDHYARDPSLLYNEPSLVDKYFAGSLSTTTEEHNLVTCPKHQAVQKCMRSVILTNTLQCLVPNSKEKTQVVYKEILKEEEKTGSILLIVVNTTDLTQIQAAWIL